jgi:hypothetical protein
MRKKKINIKIGGSIPKMKSNPPITGVPSLDLCHLGPISKIFCPSFLDFKNGIRTLPSKIAIMRENISGAAI